MYLTCPKLHGFSHRIRFNKHKASIFPVLGGVEKMKIGSMTPQAGAPELPEH